jgi:methyl-accepting chemotaxis protein
MNRNWTFGQKLALGYAGVVAFAVVIGATAVLALRTVVASKDRVLGVNAQVLIEAERLNTESARRAAALRGYVIAREQRHLDLLGASVNSSAQVLAKLHAAASTDDERRRLASIEQASTEYHQAGEQLVALVRSQAQDPVIERTFEDKVNPARERLAQQVRELSALEERLLSEAQQQATDVATTATLWLGVLVGAALLFALAMALVLTRLLSRQIGTAVGHVQSSSTELQSAATQQASGAKQQASAMNEITTTISELVATSRQIAESAQNVAQIASQTAAAARHGEVTVDKGQESVAGIRRQVDQVVSHMLELGKKSQEIGGVLDIVSELAEQTNILAINATIEASGAGEAGRRFAVVADEIRKLADRVAHSTKEIRALIDDVRSAVNTTVMATEGSAKAVDAGSRQFTEVAVAFKQIATLVTTTTDAAREIELSTKQQASAAEQVRTAISDVAQTTHESEASTSQTLQTASQLAGLSRDLQRLIQPQAA